MTTFEYLSVLFSLVVGLAVAQTLQGLLRVVRHRRTATVHLPVLIWTAAVLQWTVFFWWFTGYGLVGLDEWHLTTLLFVLLYGCTLFFLLGLLYPDDIGANFDMGAHFEDIRPWFFGLFTALGLLDLADTTLKQLLGTSAWEGRSLVEYSVFMGIWIVGSGVSSRIRSGRLVGAIGLLVFLAGLYMTNRYAGAMGPFLDLL